MFLKLIDTEYDRVKVPPYNGNDPRPTLVVKPFCFHAYETKCITRGRKGAQARYDAELLTFVSIVRHLGRSAMLDTKLISGKQIFYIANILGSMVTLGETFNTKHLPPAPVHPPPPRITPFPPSFSTSDRPPSTSDSS